jgi:hypothetical protein
MRTKLNYSLIAPLLTQFLILLLLSGCSDGTSDPDPKNGRIYGVVTFLDGTPGESAVIDLKTLPINHHRTSIANANGEYSFDELYGADYVLKFQSTGSEINGFESELTLESGKELRKDITITFSILEDALAKSINNDVIMIKYEPNSAHIGDNYDLVEYLTGGFYGDFEGVATLSADVYLIPSSVAWWEIDFEITADSIRNNFESVMEIVEEEGNFGGHVIRIEGENIIKILSNPENGFAFVKKGDDNKILKIPCVDRANNDFGLQIVYK